ncbi:hypothetical protein V6Z11_A13G084600 [Gossypium hirsutum]
MHLFVAMATVPSPITSISPPKSKFNEKISRFETLNPPQNPLSLLPKCTSLKELKQIQAFTIKTHLQNDLNFLTKFINFCTKSPTFNSMEYAHKLFDNISQPDVVLFNTMARGYSRSNTPIQAIPLFSQLLSFGFLPDDYTFPSVLKACSSAKALKEGKQIHCLVIKLGLNHNIYICPSLISMYTECNDVDSARRVFDKMLDPCVISYNAIITGYAKCSRPNEALSLFRELQVKSLKPTDVTMLSVLSCCALLGALDLGKWMHEYVKKNGLDKNIKVSTALIGKVWELGGCNLCF